MQMKMAVICLNYTFPISLLFVDIMFCEVNPSSLLVPFNPKKAPIKAIPGFILDRTDHIGNLLATF